jgi:putative lipoic acid-binding regulatory protein
MSKKSDFYEKLKGTLEETTTFPTKYMFKFIIPSNDDNFKKIESIFDNIGAVINSKPSKTGKYTSLTILVKMESADEIIVKYKEVSKIEGVISL